MRRTISLLVVLGALGAGCGSDRDPEPSSSAAPRDREVVRESRSNGSPTATPGPVPAAPRAAAPKPQVRARATPGDVGRTTPVVRCPTATTRSLADSGVAAVLRRAAPVHVFPGGPVRTTFRRLNENGVATTFRVLGATVGPDCQTPWYRVQVPIRPNGATAWVRASAVRRYRVAYRILVDLSDRRITVFHGTRTLLHTRTAIGRPQTPTPVGSFYVNQRLLTSDPTGPWGPGGIGVSAFSPVLTGWTQGGPIGIHGTNQPHTIGLAASNGCLRIPNAVLSRLIHLIPDGTPVRIRA